ncbi:MAG TPA: ABC transporter permease subunit [Anaerolineae bacterium]
MAEMSPQSRQSNESIPFWRDVRVLGVLAQIAFVVFVIVAAGWFLGNVLENIGQLGAFRCPDGTINVRCGFTFLEIDAQFDISETPVEYEPSDSFGRALWVGVLNTVKVTFWGIILATILGTLAGIARLSPNWLVDNVAKWYVDIMRNTPLLLQLFFIAFAVIAVFPQIREAIQLFGLPVYLSQRGINLAWPVLMPSFAIWFAFIVLGIVQAQVLWIILGRQEEKTGKEINRSAWVIVSFLIVAAVGWYVSSASVDNQAIMVPQSARVQEFEDLRALMQDRLGLEDLSEIEVALAEGSLTAEQVEEASLRVCTLENSTSEVNFTSQLRAANIPYVVDRSSRLSQVTGAYAAGECDVFVDSRAVLAAERNLLENSANHVIVPVPEAPVRLSVPRIEGLNFAGGIKLTPQFAAILIGLVLYTGAFIAEIVRAGIQSVPRGQTEAAKALGLSESQRLRLVVLPQALRVIIPPLTSQYLNLAKNSSLAIAVGFPDLWSTAYTTLNQSGQVVQVFLIVMAYYLSLSLLISALLNWYNRRIALVER